MSTLVTTKKNGSMANSNSNGLSFPTWSSWIDEMFNRDLPSVFTSNFNSGPTLPKVNIRETKDAYVVDMAVPGGKKSDFQISIDNQLLSIARELEDQSHQQDDHYTRREFGYDSFRRSFTLPETVKEEHIKASYNQGILSIHLPKKEEAIQKPARTITIS
ncbi:Hsp20/alpha crystallin family protein [Arenibacter sp. GZD96]|uniref:Hsp20/alpha crystallin family protein n=1 Tax=Aurantibrevibacter litoralis TaxID=3106030 RepID=UPI002AFE2F25|nr:Hsp20/alpha crystallin family protein [Arenibacter sp. GZD-96]MEA1785122.1 Hsp20/alpha crystallin family protein [Arenibacter sp. GZD-96]